MYLSWNMFFMNSVLSLWFPLPQLWAPFGCPWAPFGCPLGSCGSLWNALGLPLAGLWVPFGRPGTYGVRFKFIKKNIRLDERGCNPTSKPVIIDGRGEIPNNNTDIEYRKMSQIHETVFKNQFFGICMVVPPVPLVPLVPRKCVSQTPSN